VTALENTIARIELEDGVPAWHVSRYPEVKALLTDQRLTMFIPDAQSAGWDVDSKVHQILVRVATGRKRGVLPDPEDRVLRRRIMNKMFAGPNVLRVTPLIRDIATELVDTIKGQDGVVELGRMFSSPLCARTMSELLGIPPEDAKEFPAWTDEATTPDGGQSMAAMRRFMGYVHKMLAERKREPREDVVTELLVARDENDTLHEQRLTNILAWMLSLGWQGPASSVDCACALLLTNPDQFQLIKDDPSLVPAAVEEVIRLFNSQPASNGMVVRYALSEIEFAGITIEPGERVLLDVWAANRDPSVFTDPDTFDITRSPNPHVGFGHGVYMCNFAKVARAELEISMSALAAGLPEMRLAEPVEDLEYINPGRPMGLSRLPIHW
jgi:cytochrome P450